MRPLVPVSSVLQTLLSRPKVRAAAPPGLLLDKYLASYEKGTTAGKFSERVQRPAVEEIARLSQKAPAGLDWEDLRKRRLVGLRTLGVVPWTRTTASRLTLHLSRASALENAGLCLHPIYGFAYLPGTGLKGMARAYADQVWKPAQPDQGASQQLIEQVFGNAPAEPDAEKQRAGAVVFHDAWPTTWPRLVVDIVNNHHTDYYQGKDAPGDWESPGPNYFLAVDRGQEFSFALGKRRADVPGRWLTEARAWLDGALTLLGCGAKTAAGYGTFTPLAPVPQSSARATFDFTLKLTAPAFLAGAQQYGLDAEADCDLRPATLRGLLRWWWRAVHVGFVDLPTLRAMEAAVWGDTNQGGPVRITLDPLGKVAPILYDKWAEQRARTLPAPENRQTTQGLWYHSFGMDDNRRVDGSQRRVQRYYLPAETRWAVRFLVRDGYFTCGDGERRIGRTLILDQVKTALWWFCRIGGAGSKSRKGFGSFADYNDFEGGKYLTRGKEFRAACGLPEREFNLALADSPSIKLMRDLSNELGWSGTPGLELETRYRDPWHLLDLLGSAAQSFAQASPSTGHGKHSPAKLGLGLPRSIHRGPQRQPLHAVHGDRFASPLFYHVAQGENGMLTARVAAFPSRHLRESHVPPDRGLVQHTALLRQLLQHLQQYLRQHLGG